MQVSCGLFLSAICAVSLAVQAEVPTLIAIKDARVVPVKGATLDKATVVIRDGLIADVGPAVQAPAGAFVIEGAGLTVYPGLIDAYSTWGVPQSAPTVPSATTGRGAGAPAALVSPAQGTHLRSWGPADRPGTSTWVRSADLVRTTDSRLEAARSAGFTTAMNFPRGGLIGGHGAAINLGGETGGAMVLSPSIGLQMSWPQPGTGGYAGFPNTQMGAMSYFRQLWLDAAYYKQAQAAYTQRPGEVKRPDYDRALENLNGFPRVLLPAPTLVQMERALKLAAELQVTPVLYAATEGYKMATALKMSGAAVILNVKWPARDRDTDPEQVDTLRVLEVRDMAPQSPKSLAAAGVPFAVSSEGIDAPRDIVRALKKSIDQGLSKEDALKALTISPAEIFGLSSKVGSIEAGKIANLAVTDGDLFDDKTKVKMVFIDGVKYVPAPQAPTSPGSGGPPGQRPGAATEEVDDEVIR